MTGLSKCISGFWFMASFFGYLIYVRFQGGVIWFANSFLFWMLKSRCQSFLYRSFGSRLRPRASNCFDFFWISQQFACNKRCSASSTLHLQPAIMIRDKNSKRFIMIYHDSSRFRTYSRMVFQQKHWKPTTWVFPKIVVSQNGWWK